MESSCRKLRQGLNSVSGQVQNVEEIVRKYIEQKRDSHSKMAVSFLQVKKNYPSIASTISLVLFHIFSTFNK